MLHIPMFFSPDDGRQAVRTFRVDMYPFVLFGALLHALQRISRCRFERLVKDMLTQLTLDFAASPEQDTTITSKKHVQILSTQYS